MALLFHVNTLFNSISYRFDGCLIDPGDVWEAFERVTAVLLTHVHFDHVYGLNELLKLSPDALVYTNDVGREMLLDVRENMSLYHETPFVFEHPGHVKVVNHGDEIGLGCGMVARAVFTPGHNPSCITWVVGDMVFSGDSLIPGIRTVTNLHGGNKVEAAESESLIKQISTGKTIYPGHCLQ